MATVADLLPPLPGRRKSLPTAHFKTAIKKYSGHKPPFIDNSLPKDRSGYRQTAYRPSASGRPPSNPPNRSTQAMTVTAEDWPEMGWMYWTVDYEDQSLIVKPFDSPPVPGWFGWRQWYELETQWSEHFILYTADPNFQKAIRVEPQDVPVPSIESPLRANAHVPTLIPRNENRIFEGPHRRNAQGFIPESASRTMVVPLGRINVGNNGDGRLGDRLPAHGLPTLQSTIQNTRTPNQSSFHGDFHAARRFVPPYALPEQDINQFGSNDGIGADIQQPPTMSDAIEILRDAVAGPTVVYNFGRFFSEYSPEDLLDVDRAVRWASESGHQHLANRLRELKQKPQASTTRHARTNPPLEQEHARRIKLEPEY